MMKDGAGSRSDPTKIAIKRRFCRLFMVKNALPSHAVQNNCAFISLLTHNILFLQRICRKIVAWRELHTIQKSKI